MREEQKQTLLSLLDQAESLREVKDVFRIYLSNIKTEEDLTREVVKEIKLINARKGGIWTGVPRTHKASAGEVERVIPTDETNLNT
ncbi:hypothetical protein FZC83_01930 [Rossellomorea marisflavi]|uniref:Uncharacterized protein n=1 Tax=Rossellomorea marisflavi TaxID=189381 RepID=A0A5D4S2M1_9BACI|nr:hypothetical protein [Rossellomorea marisflavi]TYS56354.1 hypothetical protein FZC83_01930 [Rossellomorea marisflavi]